MTEIKMPGGVTITKAGDLPNNIFLMLWGSSGVGKTTLACTMPGRKLLVNFDPGGAGSIASRNDVDVADYSSIGSGITEEFKRNNDPLGLRKICEEYDTIIFDSLTTIGELAVDRGISITKGATIERPSPGAYGARNALILKLVSNGLKMGSEMNKHICFIAHQGAPQTDDGGAVSSIPIYLGGQLPAQTSLRFSEVLALYELSNKKTIAIRPCRFREPMKSRMFLTSGSPEFGVDYNADTDSGTTIAEWHQLWIAAGKKKLPLPDSAEYKALRKKFLS